MQKNTVTRTLGWLFVLLLQCAVFSPALAQSSLQLLYDKPAQKWTEALPVGNGQLGAMVFGGIEHELLQLNEATLWSGGPINPNPNPASASYLPKVREALFAGKYEEANRLVKKMQGLYSESYMPMGDVHIEQDLGLATVTDYQRTLKLADAMAITSFTANGVQYKREVFASAAHRNLIVRITASKQGQLNLRIRASSLMRIQPVAMAAQQMLLIKGKAPAHVDPNYFRDNKEPVIQNDANGCRGMRFAMGIQASLQDGSMQIDTSGLQVSNATTLTLHISAATSFNGFDKCPDSEGKDELALMQQYLSVTKALPYFQLRSKHSEAFQHYFNRVTMWLNEEKDAMAAVPTDQRLEAYTKGANDPGLEVLYFQYGRYLLISSSQTPNVPANLQGIWNKELRAPWSSNYTTNINVQMNYWPAEATNLAEMHQPLLGFLNKLAVTGAVTAKNFYNINSGWVVNHNSDIWALSNPVGDTGKGDPKWANWAMGANWLSRHAWEHYQFTGNKKFLKDTAYPLMKGAAQFTLQWLIPDANGRLVTAPSTSPENDYYYDGNKKTGMTIASTMDMSIIKDLFDNLIAAQQVLQSDKAFIDSVQQAKALLHPFQIGSKGQLQEWYNDVVDVDPEHRHVSHLYSLYPAKLISATRTPALAAAAKQTLLMRGDGGTGWSLGWKVNFWARLLDGDHAYKLYRNLMRLVREDGIVMSGGGIYPNMFDAHPPFQIDGNFAGTAGVSEMLLQSQDNELHLLPALPTAWHSGHVSGLVGRGNFVVSLTWQNNALQRAGIQSRNGGVCVVRSAAPLLVNGMAVAAEKTAIGYVMRFNTQAGKYYLLTVKP